MAALTGNKDLNKRLTKNMAAQIVDAATLYAGGYAAGVGAGHGTAAKRGRLEPWSAASFQIPLGLTLPGTDTLKGAIAATPIPEAGLSTERVIVNDVTVTGVTGIEDLWKAVYAINDNVSDLTIVKPAVNGIPVGFIARHRTATRVDVALYDAFDLQKIALAGSGTAVMQFPVSAVRTTTGDLITGFVAPYHGRFLSVFGSVKRKAATATLDYAINLEIGGVDVAGGVVTWVFADAVAAKKSGTAITGDNVFHQGDLIDVEAVVTGAGAGSDVGDMTLFAQVELLPGV